MTEISETEALTLDLDSPHEMLGSLANMEALADDEWGGLLQPENLYVQEFDEPDQWTEAKAGTKSKELSIRELNKRIGWVRGEMR